MNLPRGVRILALIGSCVVSNTLHADALDDAAKVAGVSRWVVERIIKVESGGHPYVLNTNSDLGSLRFKTMEGARNGLAILLSKGYRNIDVGPAQINIRWHPDLYQSPEDLLNPRKNIIAAGHVLRKTKEAGARNLREQVGHYHSKTPERAKKYSKMVLGNDH